MGGNRYAIGVDLGGTSIKVGLVSAEGKIVIKKELKSRAYENPEAVIQQVVKGINSVSVNYDKNIIGVGIGAAGSVIKKKGTVENPPNFNNWISVPLKKILKDRINKNVFVENDANAAAIGELIFGAGCNLKNFILVTLGTGVGGGIIINRKIYHGENGAAGEIGHITINSNGPKCNCGSYGCIEAYIGKNYLIRRIERKLSAKSNTQLNNFMNKSNSELSTKLIGKAAGHGDDFSIAIIRDVGVKLGAALSSVINLLDIHNVIIGGGMSGFGNLLIKSTSESINSRVMKSLRGKVKVASAGLKNNAGIIGASALVFYKQ